MSIQLPDTDHLERAILGCCLLGGHRTVLEALSLVPDSAFTPGRTQDAYRLLKTISESSPVVDPLLFRSEWKKLHQSDCLDLLATQDEVPSAANLTYYTKQLLEESSRRRAVLISDEIRSGLASGSLSIHEASQKLEALSQGPSKDEVRVFNASEFCHAGVSDLETRHQQAQAGVSPYHRTGIPALDRQTDGIGYGEMVVVGARPSVGKSALAVSLAETICIRGGTPFHIISTEMTESAFYRRLVANLTGIDSRVFKRMDAYSEKDHAQVAKANELIKRAPFFFVDATDGITDAQIRAYTQSAQSKDEAVLCVDYLQNIRASTKHEKRTYELAGVSQTIQGITRRFPFSAVVLAQLNRGPDSEKRLPRVNDLRDSGQIEQDADQIWLLHREKDEEGIASSKGMIICAKGRDGELGVVKMNYEAKTSKWSQCPNAYGVSF